MGIEALLVQAALAALPVLAPVVVAALKGLVAQAGAEIPNVVKPLINAVVALVIGAVSGSDPASSLIMGQIGKSVRDANDKSPVV